MRWAGNVTHMEAVTNAYNIWIVRPEEKKSLAIPRRRWKNIKMDLTEVVNGLDS
jgi:hypothetical protein